MAGMLGDPALGGVALAVLFLALAGQPGIGGGGVGLGTDEPGHEGMTPLWPSATTAGQTMEWKCWGVLALPTWRVEHWSQWMV